MWVFRKNLYKKDMRHMRDWADFADGKEVTFETPESKRGSMPTRCGIPLLIHRDWCEEIA